jgi:hypothetical protein
MKPFKLLRGYKEDPIRWRAHNGVVWRLSDMSMDHIVNVVRCLRGEGNMRIPNPYEGKTLNEWQIIFHHELIRRRRSERV